MACTHIQFTDEIDWYCWFFFKMNVHINRVFRASTGLRTRFSEDSKRTRAIQLDRIRRVVIVCRQVIFCDARRRRSFLFPIVIVVHFRTEPGDSGGNVVVVWNARVHHAGSRRPTASISHFWRARYFCFPTFARPRNGGGSRSSSRFRPSEIAHGQRSIRIV